MIVVLGIFLGFCGWFYDFIFFYFYFCILSLLKSLNQKGQNVTPHLPYPQKKKMNGQRKPSCLLVPASCHSLSDVKFTINSITKNHF